MKTVPSHIITGCIIPKILHDISVSILSYQISILWGF